MKYVVVVMVVTLFALLIRFLQGWFDSRRARNETPPEPMLWNSHEWMLENDEIYREIDAARRRPVAPFRDFIDIPASFGKSTFPIPPPPKRGPDPELTFTDWLDLKKEAGREF